METKEITEILTEKEFKEKFKINDNARINEIAKLTNKVVTGKNTDNDMVELTGILSIYGISINAYFDFWGNILTRELRDVNTSEEILNAYVKTLEEIEKSDLTIEDKIVERSKVIDGMSKNRKMVENSELKGFFAKSSVAMVAVVTVIAGGLTGYDKYTKYKIAMENRKSIVKVLGGLGKGVASIATAITGKK